MTPLCPMIRRPLASSPAGSPQFIQNSWAKLDETNVDVGFDSACSLMIGRSRRADYVGWRGRPVERHHAAACRARRKRTGRPVAWRTVGKLGATARRVHYRMIGDINDRPDVLIVCVGSNDMLAGRSVRENGPLTSPRCWTRPRTRPARWCTLLLVTPSTTAAKPSVMISPSSLSDWSDLLPWQCCSMMCIAIFDSMVVRTLKGVYWLIMMAAVTCGYGGRCLNESATPFRLEIVQITSERVLHFHLDSGGTIEKS